MRALGGYLMSMRRTPLSPFHSIAMEVPSSGMSKPSSPGDLWKEESVTDGGISRSQATCLGHACLRAFEVTVAIVALLLTLPVTLPLALLIRLTSPGPALFFQDRLGRGAKRFRFVKFRTMHVDARQRFPELYAYSYDDETIQRMKFKLDNDPRLTAVGRVLRKTSLDELPNFWNVLRGDMALVGPRPEIPEMLPYYKGDMRRKFDVRPGVTGLAQVSGRGYLGFMDTVALDLEYVRRRSLRYDLWILVRTVKKVLTGDGAF